MMGKRALISLFILNLLAGLLGAQERPWWFSLEQGKFYFRGGDYGGALNAFEDARRGRREAFTRMEQNLIILLSLPEARRLGDSLDRVEAYITGRSQSDAAAALRELYYRVPRESLGGSVNRALNELGKFKDYPEAEYWIGEVYRLEGELGLAVKQYQRALELRELLEDPLFEVDIYYKMAELHRARREYIEMEKDIKEIIEGRGRDGEPKDSLWAGDSGSFARRSMAEILGREDGITRFLTIYRYNNTLVEKAHRFLGFFYYDSGRHSPGPALEQLMFAFLIQNTVIIEELIRRRYDFTFTGLEGLMEEVRKLPLLLAYLDETEYFKTLYYLGSSIFGEGKLAAARQFWLFLARCPEAGQWGDRARRQLASPRVERPVIDSGG
jgi:tetratricopeptide (TPR) repeat protein